MYEVLHVASGDKGLEKARGCGAEMSAASILRIAVNVTEYSSRCGMTRQLIRLRNLTGKSRKISENVVRYRVECKSAQSDRSEIFSTCRSAKARIEK